MQGLKFFTFCLACTIYTTLGELTESGLDVQVVSKPDSCDREVKRGDLLSMHYTGTLQDGTKFDSSRDRSEPFKFQIGVGQVIAGWEEGVLGMCVGENRKLVVPPQLGYGDQGAGEVIPPGATLNFDIELVNIEDGPTPVNVFKQIDRDGDNALTREEIQGYLKEQMDGMRAAGMEGTPDEATAQQEQEKIVEEIFMHEDKDKDGVISHEEFSGPKHDEL